MRSSIQQIVLAIAGAGILLIGACERKKETSPPPPPDPLTACRSECRATSERMFKDCTDRLRAQGAFDRLSECNTDADTYYSQCRTECRERYLAQSSEAE